MDDDLRQDESINSKSNKQFLDKILKTYLTPYSSVGAGALVPVYPNDIISIWDRIKPIIEILEMTIPPAVALIKLIIHMKNKNVKDAEEFLGDILEKESWDLNEFSELYGLNKDDSKKLLKGFQYKWDRNKRIYISTIDRNKILGILRNSSRFNIK